LRGRDLARSLQRFIASSLKRFNDPLDFSLLAAQCLDHLRP
jgi:hypothetical protein